MRTRQGTIDLGERKAGGQRRFPVSISSETPVRRKDGYGEPVEEVLSHARGAVDLSRAPLPLLEAHDRSRLNVGLVDNLRVESGRLRGEIVLGTSQRAQELGDDIEAGVLRGISVGYVVEDLERDPEHHRVVATRWVPHEVSLVSVPADSTVGIGRSSTMADETMTNADHETGEHAETRSAAAPEAERQRVADILTIVERVHLPPAFARRLVAEGASVDEARMRALNALAEENDRIRTEQHVRLDDRVPIYPGDDYGGDFRAAAIDAICLRAGLKVARPHPAAGDISTSVYDLARTCLSRAGRSGGRPREARGPALLRRAAGTGDFPFILEGALHASVRTGYESEPSSHRAWVRAVPFVDFRPASRPLLGSAPDLDQLQEHSEYKNGYFVDEGTSYTISKFGKIIALTWESLLADNLGAFIRVQPALGSAARRLESDLVYGLLAQNSGAGPTMPDSKPLFDATHSNLVAAGAFDVNLLSAGRTLLRRQKALGGGYLSLVPRTLLVPPERESSAEILLANASRRTTSDKAGPDWPAELQLVTEARLPNGAAYLIADSSQVDSVELGLLEENLGGPHIETEQGFNRDESRWKVRHTAGVKALDHRGMVKLPITP